MSWSDHVSHVSEASGVVNQAGVAHQCKSQPAQAYHVPSAVTRHQALISALMLLPCGALHSEEQETICPESGCTRPKETGVPRNTDSKGSKGQMTDQLSDKLRCPRILLWEACVIGNLLQQRRCLQRRPQHKQVRKVQVLHPLPHRCTNEAFL